MLLTWRKERFDEARARRMQMVRNATVGHSTAADEAAQITCLAQGWERHPNVPCVARPLQKNNQYNTFSESGERNYAQSPGRPVSNVCPSRYLVREIRTRAARRRDGRAAPYIFFERQLKVPDDRLLVCNVETLVRRVCKKNKKREKILGKGGR